MAVETTTTHLCPLLMAMAMVVFSLCRACVGAKIHVCSQAWWEIPIVMEGEPTRMCCDLGDFCRADNSSSLDDSLTLLPKGMSGSENTSELFEMYRPDACTVELLVKHPPHGGFSLVCRRNGSPVARTAIRVIPNPPVPNIIKVTSTPDKMITVRFDRMTRGLFYVDNYTVSMTEHIVPSQNKTRTVTLCSSTESSSDLECPQGERICECRYVETDEEHDSISDHNITVRVTVERFLLHVDTQQTIKLIDHIEPEAPQIVGIEKISEHVVTVEVCLPTRTWKVNGLLRSYNSSLRYQLVLSKTEGVQEFVTVNIKADNELQCVKLTFTNLRAYMTYSLNVNLMAAEKSPTRSTQFTTLPAAPARPPELDQFAFSRSSEHNVLAVVWQHLPRDEQGGADLTYDLEVWSLTGLELSEFNITDNHWTTSKPLPEGHLQVRVWAHNEVDKSENFSSLDVPSVSDIRPVRFLVEVSKRKLRVHIKPEDNRGYKQMLVHTCKTSTRQAGLEACSSYPQTLSLSVPDAFDAPNEDDDIHTFYLSPSNTDPVDTTVEQSLDYRFTEGVDNRHAGVNDWSEMRTTVALVETQVQQTEVTWVRVDTETFFDSEDSDLEESSGDEMSDEDIVEDRDDDPTPQEQHKTKRSASVSGSRVAATPDGQQETKRARRDVLVQGRRRLMAVLNESSDVETTIELTSLSLDAGIARQDDLDPVFYPVFVSAQAEDKTWLGMNPAECYFSQQSDNVRLIISQEPSSTSDSTWIRWKQDCDQNPQFLAEAFQVSVSSDEACKHNVSVVGKIVNSVFEPMRMAVPLGWLFVCIRAFRGQSVALDSEPFVSQAQVKSVEQPMLASSSSTDTTSIIMPFVTSAVGVVLIVGLLCCMRCCKRGRDKGSANKHQIQQMLDGTLDEKVKDKLTHGQAVELTEGHKWTSEQSCLSTVTGDSGQGTLYSQDSTGSTQDTAQSGGSHSVSRYARQGQGVTDNRHGGQGVADNQRGRTIETSGSSNDVVYETRHFEDSQATSNGDDWLDSSACDSGQSSHSHSGSRGLTTGGSSCRVAMETLIGSIPEATSDGADWLDDSSEGETSFSTIGEVGV